MWFNCYLCMCNVVSTLLHFGNFSGISGIPTNVLFCVRTFFYIIRILCGIFRDKHLITRVIFSVVDSIHVLSHCRALSIPESLQTIQRDYQKLKDERELLENELHSFLSLYAEKQTQLKAIVAVSTQSTVHNNNCGSNLINDRYRRTDDWKELMNINKKRYCNWNREYTHWWEHVEEYLLRTKSLRKRWLKLLLPVSSWWLQ